MATIAWPSCAFITNVVWTLDQPAQVNRSQWTGKRQVTILAVAAQWSAKVTFELKADEDSSLDMQAFVVDLQGVANTTLLPGSAGPQFGSAISAQVDGAGQIGFALNIKGAPAGTILKRGHKITIGGQMVMVMAAATVGGDGKAALSIKPALRAASVDNAAVEVVNPACRVALKNTANGWSSEYGYSGKPDASYTFSLEFEEVF